VTADSRCLPDSIDRPVNTVIHWLRRDLRVADNTALSEASRRANRVVPVFIVEDAFRTGSDVGPARLAFLLRSLEGLKTALSRLGYPMIVRHGRSEEVLPALAKEIGADAVFCNKRPEPYAQARDSRAVNALYAAGIGFESFKDAVVWEEQEILTQAGQPFTVFTPYSKAWKARKIPPPRPALPPAEFSAVGRGVPAEPISKARRRRRLTGTVRPTFLEQPLEIRSEPVPVDPAGLGHPLRQTLPPAGEAAARETLRRFMSGPVLRYGEARDFPAADGTSQLSPHLRAGTIGIRTVLAQLTRARAQAKMPAQRRGCDVFLGELIWREFSQQALFNFPHVTKGAFRPEYDRLEWSGEEEHFQAWCAGRTGYPIVDAAMRCLNATGWMHNRLRMIVAMFLTKDLLIHWQEGEHYFMQQLVDGDLAANNGGWQWSAGTGTDAAPYFRIFNPVSQGEKFDSAGEFVRRWVPELAALPQKLIHRPWEDAAVARQLNYPRRIVIHEEQRPRCLAMFKKARGATGRSGGA
jgi:deoxyribodipyrimidine photo-lyase